eukprot:CAMPEP_0176089892 /NCGR_PEP_ID=MMETSP0120_2-20121206/45021_1 /TAXON_ID=160619 /ORGANISM="Kryptoperidinium foliaceum, Strain CCMP 1326" /LENGTH=453 /DNA_ID=CAMNT_0017423775 /DNA_START=72 /DNA_END=1433 /DNA_ORIENTATION=+
MVVAQVVRIRNNTLKTFSVKAGDPFYTPRVDGRPSASATIEVPPGFDQEADGLVIPWEAMTVGGLEIAENGDADSSDDDRGGYPASLVRCVVGPVEDDREQRDWLQFRSSSWEPVAAERWFTLGRRHYFGAVGGSVELLLTFRDARQDTRSPAQLAEVIHFDFATRCAPPNMVFLNVFDLASAVSIPNAILCNTVFNTIGAFHAAVEVYGEEFSFYRTPNPKACGLCKSLRPRQHPIHVYRQSVPLGTTTLKDWEVRYLIRVKLSSVWRGGSYDLLHRNCIHFCDELLLCLGVNGVPAWVRGLHETGAGVLKITWPLTFILGGDVSGKPRACEDGEEEDEEADGLHSTQGDGQTGTAPSSTCGTSAVAVGVAPHRGPLLATASSSSSGPGKMISIAAASQKAAQNRIDASGIIGDSFINTGEDVQLRSSRTSFCGRLSPEQGRHRQDAATFKR